MQNFSLCLSQSRLNNTHIHFNCQKALHINGSHFEKPPNDVKITTWQQQAFLNLYYMYQISTGQFTNNQNRYYIMFELHGIRVINSN